MDTRRRDDGVRPRPAVALDIGATKIAAALVDCDGRILGGRLPGGASGKAGHVGHAPVVVDGEPCPCGGRGCPEAYASGPSMVRWALRNGWRPRDAGDGVELAASARAGDPCAAEAFARGGRVLGAMIAATAATCDISRVVVGGGVAQAGELLMEPLRRSLNDH